MSRLIYLVLLLLVIGGTHAMPPPKKSMSATRQTVALARAAAAAAAASAQRTNQLGTVSANNTRCELPSSPAAPSTTLASPAAKRKAELRAAQREAETASETTENKAKEAQRKAKERAGIYYTPTTRGLCFVQITSRKTCSSTSVVSLPSLQTITHYSTVPHCPPCRQLR